MSDFSYSITSSVKRNFKTLRAGARNPGFCRDSVCAQRMPIGRRIDGDDRLAEPQLGSGGKSNHAEVGADLDERIGVAAVAVQLNQLLADKSGATSAMPVQLLHSRQMSRTTSKPDLVK